MDWLNNLQLKRKFLLLVSFILSFVIIIVLLIYNEFNSINNSYNNLVQKEFFNYSEIKNIYAQGLQSEQAIRNMMINPNDQSAKKNYEKANELFEKSLSKLKISMEETILIDKLNQILDKWENLKRLKNEIQVLSKNNNFEKSKELLINNETPLWRDIKEILFYLENYQKNKIDVIRSEFLASLSRNSIILLLGGFVIVLLTLGFVFYFSKIIINPIKNLNKAVKEIINGNYNIELIINSKDEIGELSIAFNEMIEKIKLQLQYLDNIPSPVMIIDKEYNIQYMNKVGAELVGKNQNQLIGQKCYEQMRTEHCNTENCALKKAMKNDSIFSEETIANPNGKKLPVLYTGAPIKNKEGKIIGALEAVADISNIKEIQNYLNRSTQKLMIEMEKFANGDLTVEVTPEKENDDIGKLFKGFNKAVTNIKEIINNLIQAVQATASASNQISSSTEELAAGAQEQSAQTSEIASAVNQMTATIVQTTKHAGEAANTSKDAGDFAKEGGKAVEKTIEGMNKIATVVTKAATVVQELGKGSEQIGEIVQVIDDIADQTNLLALNAAIEAARAGEQGRGFAVVADEVRKLAERTTKATKEIADMIKKIQVDTKEAVVSMSEGTKEVEIGIELAQNAGTSLQEIINAVIKVSDIIAQVAAASEEQSSAAEQISKNVESISNVSHETASGTQQIARAAEDLNRLTENLQNLIDNFKIDNNNRRSLSNYTLN